VKLFRREWIFPGLAIVFVAASAHAQHVMGRDELSAQAAVDMHCNSVSIIQSSATQFLATGCGQDRTYTCEEGDCTLDSDGSHAAGTPHDPADDAAAEAVAEALFDVGCACASAAMTSHHSHHSSTTTRRK
jgi:hypothetical protein